jgi:hypothetical protein
MARRSRFSQEVRERAVHDRDLREVIAFTEVGGLHHRYERRAA